MLWEILVLAEHHRHEFVSQLLSLLEPQIRSLGLRRSGHVSVSIHWDDFDPRLGIGDKRELVRQRSTGDYICFIDSDDLIAPCYTSAVLPHLNGVDIIGWEQEVWQDGVKLPQRDFHTISTVGWYDDADFHRDYSHLQPIRRELAMSQPMEGGVGEDYRWAERMRNSGPHTEYYIDKVLYYYLCRSNKNDALDAHSEFRLNMIERLRPH